MGTEVGVEMEETGDHVDPPGDVVCRGTNKKTMKAERMNERIGCTAAPEDVIWRGTKDNGRENQVGDGDGGCSCKSKGWFLCWFW